MAIGWLAVSLLGLSMAFVALQRRLSALPHAVLALVRKERAHDGGRLLDVMKEAVAARSGQAVIAIQTCQEQIAQSLRAQIAEAETRARIAERRALDTATALEAATTLVRELRATLDVSATLVRHLLAHPQAPGTPAAQGPSTDADDGERTTTEMPPASDGAPASGRQPRTAAPEDFARVRPDGGGFDDEDEQTRVADGGATLAALRRGRRSPTLLPPAPEPVGPLRQRGPGESDRAR